MPCDRAIDRVDQCVSPPGGACCSVAVITASTCSSLTVLGRPGRGSSVSPSSREARNRDRHFDTVSRETPRSAATALFEPPPAQAKMIRDRWTRAWVVLRRRDHASSARRSSPVRLRGTIFGPGTTQTYYLSTNY